MDVWMLPGWYNIGKNTIVRSAFINACKKYGIKYDFSANKKSRYGSAKSYEGGCSMLKMFNDMADRCEGRVEAAANGAVSIETYVRPKKKTAIFTINADAANGITQDGISVSSNHLSIPSRIVVEYQNDGNSKWVSGKVDSSYAKKATRGYELTKLLNADSYSEAQTKMSRAQKHYLDIRREWSLKTMYLPIWEGDCVNLYVSGMGSEYKGKRKCFVKNLDWNLGTMELSLNLKECATKYDEDKDYDG